ncbi:biopolymer transporter ExbD [Pseudomonas protegens]|jgi:biopolymer transport protein ExbD|uniref:TonB system transport protein ExbD5 n=4 Tax=Pseudomonas TaxID=286 RepID=Q4KI12_PSEF5|nr:MULTISPECIES: biopolymer transporter ExbD [Pseudomonas]BCQ59490.1 biopolymer transporter ExbD [Pseudomonas sp. Boi14]GED75739.1 biopolymer transporter ExbD [Pseudomonas fluorescens]AAY90277.1 TonB system transport protein ExbD5 [Pseudomonas protegens Pf-5]AGL82802.1 TonB system transport protein [Pseudomonas protegens CHA0]AQT07739.1 TonB system transport protein ExbD5 [Pseudomonas protegens]
MRSWDVAKKKKAHIEIIPMIDVMMFLLVFFVLISLNVIPAVGIKTQLPVASTAQQLKPQNKAVITLGLQERLQLDGQDLDESALLAQLKVLNDSSEKLVIIINSDQGVEVKRLVSVMDLLKGNGFSSVSIATRKS